MKLLDSLNDGKTEPEPPTKEEGTAPEPSSTEDQDKKDEEKTSEVIAEVGEEGQKVSNIHVAAKVGAMNLLLHSRKGHLAIVSIKSKEVLIFLLSNLIDMLLLVFRALYRRGFEG